MKIARSPFPPHWETIILPLKAILAKLYADHMGTTLWVFIEMGHLSPHLSLTLTYATELKVRDCGKVRAASFVKVADLIETNSDHWGVLFSPVNEKLVLKS